MFLFFMTRCVHLSKFLEKVSGNIAKGVKNPYLPMTEWGWQIEPVGRRISLLSLLV